MKKKRRRLARKIRKEQI